MSQPIEQALLTGYALGELEAADQARVEAYLADHPEARAEIEELRSLALVLSEELKGEAMPGLDAQRRAQIEALTGDAAPRGRVLRMDLRPLAVAAAVVLAVGGVIGFGLNTPRTDTRTQEKVVARADRQADAMIRELKNKEETQDQHSAELYALIAEDNKGKTRMPEGWGGPGSGRGGVEAKFPEASGLFPLSGPPGQAGFSISNGRVLDGVDTANVRVGLTTEATGSESESLGQGRFVFGTSDVPSEILEREQSSDRHAIGIAGGAGGGYAPPGAPGHGPGPAGAGTPAGGSYTGPTGSPAPVVNPEPATGRHANRERARVDLPSKKAEVNDALISDKPRPNVASKFEMDVKYDDATKSAETDATKEALLEAQKAEIAKSVEEIHDRYAGLVAPELKVVEERLKKLKAAPESKATTEEVEMLVRRVREIEATGHDRRRRLEDELRRQAGEDYTSVVEQPFKMTTTEPLSTIGLDIDTASYANVRRYLQSGMWPPRDAVRVDEMVNYFRYFDAPPSGEENLALHAEVAACPWNLENRLLRVAFKAKEIDPAKRGASNLVFLVDVSGSMRNANKLPLLKEGLKAMTRELREDDSVSIVTYASGVRVALEPTYGNDQATIINVLDSLNAGGSTNGAGGIQMAYEMAQRHFVDGGINRVLLCTDGDFNVGVSDTEELTRMIAEKAKSGVFLSVLGFGTGNIKDGRMQALANKGNGHYAYIDSDREAKKVLVDELCGTLITVAKDAKLQIEFSPAEISSWRLLGYSARILQAQDFNDDTKDAGEIGAGHTVIALYELTPVHRSDDGRPAVDPLKYQKTTVVTPGAPGEIANLRLRYKLPDAEQSRLRSLVVMDEGRHYGDASADFKLAASVALFGMQLAKSTYAGQTGLAATVELAQESINSANDEKGWRREFVDLVRKAIEIRERENPGQQR